MPTKYVLAAILLAVLLPGQSPAPTLDDALSLLQSGKLAEAAQALESVTARDPSNGRAWRNLGAARQQLKQPDKAIAAFQHALDVEPGMVGPVYAIAVAQASANHPSAALDWLARARATHRIDLTQATVEPAFAALKSDARFIALLPTPADFANPFVEPVKILHEWDGESPNDQFGWIARPLGGIDGSHVPAFVTSAPTKDIGGPNAGRIYVYSTQSGKLLWSVDGKPGDRLGIGIESAGDANRDGFPDVVASAPGAGKAYIYSGRDGKLLVTMSAEDPANAAGGFGRHVSGIGDVDHDGFDDVIIGAPGNAKSRGAAYVYSGRDGKLLLKLTGENEGDQFGAAVTGYTSTRRAAAHGQAGATLLVIGAPGAGANHTGRTYVYKSLTSQPAFTFDADPGGQALGAMFVTVPGDLDGDGFPDVFASDYQGAGKTPGAGRIYLYSGKTGARLFTLTGETPGEGFGSSSAIAGDVDGDGRPDLIIGAWQYSAQANSGGRAYLYSGKTGGLLRTYTCRTPGDTFGFDAVGMSNADRGGSVDLLITSGWSGVHGFHSGRIFLISSGVARAAARKE